MNTKVINKKEQLDELKIRLVEKSALSILSIGDVYQWTADCVSLFIELKVPDILIENFLRKINLSTVYGRSDPNVSKFGPFVVTDQGAVKLKSNEGELWLDEQICFAVAERNLSIIKERERLVPSPLLDFFKKRSEFSNIASSLELLEQSYGNEDVQAMFTNATAFVDNVLSSHPKLSNPRMILYDKLEMLKADPGIRGDFGVSRDIVVAIINSKCIRNLKAIHKSLPIDYNIPFQVGLGYAYLCITFLEVTLSAGKVIKQ